MVDYIKEKLRNNNVRFFANDNISQHVSDVDLKTIRKNVNDAVINLLDALVIDWENDHNTKETAKRLTKMYVDEIFSGRFTDAPKITTFPNEKNLDELYTVGPITIRSMCSHHFVPILGKVWVGVIPNETLIGLSKFNRLVQWIGARPQIQEETVEQIADEIEKVIDPQALGVVMKASHMCMSLRGVKDNDCEMTTSVMRGLFKTDLSAKQEFLRFIK